jgi:hypothetical protein
MILLGNPLFLFMFSIRLVNETFVSILLLLDPTSQKRAAEATLFLITKICLFPSQVSLTLPLVVTPSFSREFLPLLPQAFLNV